MNTFKKFLPVFVLLFVAVEAKADGAFQSLSFADAVAKAKKENKFVFVDFFTTWCGPCKMMDRQTFPDAKVSTWLKKKAIAVKYDAEREVALAERFNVQFYPTLIFLKSDGTEFDRISGFVPPDEFMKVARGLEKGESSLDRMRKEVAAQGNDPLARMQLASALAQSGKNAEALKEYLWCLDHGAEKSPDFAGIRNSYLLQELFNLSFAYEPTRKALADRAEAAGLRLRSGNSRETDVADLVTFGQMTNSEGLAIDVYDAVVAKDPNSKSVKLFDPYLFNMRVGAKRYADIVASSDVDKDIALRLKHFAGKTSPLTAIFSSDDAQKNAMQKAEAFERLMGYYQAFVGLADHTRAADLAAKVLKIDGNPNVLNGLAWSGYLSGKATETNVQQAEEALKASGGASIDVIDTLVRVLHQMGRKEEAVNRCRAALAKAETEMEKHTLKACLDEFGAAGTS